jgi:hypothetical protein
MKRSRFTEDQIFGILTNLPHSASSHSQGTIVPSILGIKDVDKAEMG